MKVLVTGAAGFIGMHVSQILLARGDRVIGLDDLNDYYDPALKESRLARLTPHPGFSFVRLDVADRAGVEQLFAAGYAACFHSALQMVARGAGADLGESSVGARVSIGKAGEGFGLAVELEVVIPDLPHDEAQALADKAHQVCPYSNATRGNIDVTVTVSED